MIARHLRFWCALVMVCLSTSALGTPQNGWWWNPDESGRGYYLEWQGDQLFIAGYFYEPDGRATWMIAGGTMSGPQSFSSRLFSFRGGQSLLGNYVAPSSPSETGSLTLEFTAPDKGTLTWPGGTTHIQRHVFALGEATFQPTGWWWNPDESGRGFSIEVQGDTLFVAAFMYDASGNPIWYISSGKLSTPRTYAGTLLQVSGGQTMGGSYRPPTAQVPIGSVEIEFASEDAATITLSDQPLSTRAHVDAHSGAIARTVNALPSRRSNLVRQMTRPGPLQTTPYNWVGEISKSFRAPIDDGVVELSIEIPNALFYRVTDDGVWPARYTLGNGDAQISYKMTYSGCSFQGTATYDMANTEATVFLRQSGGYFGANIAERETMIDVTGVCAGQELALPPVAVSVDLEITDSALWRGRMVGYHAPPNSGGELVYRWFLSPKERTE